jgi:hypothetical protein
MYRRTFSMMVAACGLAVAGKSVVGQHADDREKDRWGNLTASFIYDGDRPAPKPVVFDKAPPPLKGPLLRQSLVVDPMTKGIANIVCWLYVAKDAKPPAGHTSYDKAAEEPVRLLFRDFQLDPRITLCRPGQTLRVENADPIAYSLKGDFFANPGLALLLLVGDSVNREFARQESRPTPMSCAIHPWIEGYILIRESPYMAVSDEKGNLTIKNFPVGEHTFVFWHELAGFIVDVKRDGTPEQWKSGRVTVEIKPGENDLGVILCKPDRKN